MNDRGRCFRKNIPLPFFPDGSELEHLSGPPGMGTLQTLAIAELELRAGADDIDGTVVWYDITKLSGSGTHQETSVSDLQRAIREAGFTPVERDTLYRRVERKGSEWRVVG